MARRSPQTAGKRAREQAKQEKRERKLAKKAAAAAARNPAGQVTEPQAEAGSIERPAESDRTLDEDAAEST